MSNGTQRQVYDDGVAKARAKVEGQMVHIVEATDLFDLEWQTINEMMVRLADRMNDFADAIKKAAVQRWPTRRRG